MESKYLRNDDQKLVIRYTYILLVQSRCVYMYIGIGQVLYLFIIIKLMNYLFFAKHMPGVLDQHYNFNGLCYLRPSKYRLPNIYHF